MTDTPRTEAGRRLLMLLTTKDGYTPFTADILAIEAEAATLDAGDGLDAAWAEDEEWHLTLVAALRALAAKLRKGPR